MGTIDTARAVAAGFHQQSEQSMTMLKADSDATAALPQANRRAEVYSGCFRSLVAPIGASKKTAAITAVVSPSRRSRNRETVRSQSRRSASAANFRQEILMPSSHKLPTARLLLA